MASLLKYFDRAAAAFHANKRRYGREEAQARVAYTSRTVYIGNLAWATHDSQIETLFGMAGPVERVIMGLNKITKRPCGFAFVMCVDGGR
jgi:nuclear cap-binding protein subunit 2